MIKSSQNSCSPRPSNTGAQNTCEGGLRALVDWLAVTLKSVHDVHDVCDILGLDFLLFRDCEKGGKGYLKQLRFGDIAIYYAGRDDMGIHIEMSGEGCRQFELYSTANWSMFFALLLNFDVNFTRLDIAIDDFFGYLHLKTMKRKLRNAEVRSKFKYAREITKRKICDGSSKGDTLYLGSESSRIQIRFYDKLLEREAKGLQVENSVTHWVRTELQLRDDRADKAAFLIANDYEDVGRLSKGILSNYVAFLVKSNDTNKSRWKLAKFWVDFLSEAEKLSLSQVAPDRTIEKSYNWMIRQVTTSLSMLYEAFGRNDEFINDLLQDGYSKMDVTHLDMIERFKKKKESSRNEDSQL